MSDHPVDPPREDADRGPALAVDALTVEFKTSAGWRPAVRDVSFRIERDEVFGLVGESGSGKSVTAMSILGLHSRRSTRIGADSSILLGRTQLAHRSSRSLDAVRGARVGTIFQEPMTSLNPAYTIGEQIAESARRHLHLSRRDAAARAVSLLDDVGIPNAARNADQYPHHFSGGMRQRAMIAMALACGPELLIADEPTTALDVTVQAMILDLLGALQKERRMSVLLITHDLGVIAEMADRVGVMYAGELVEIESTAPLYRTPRHPYSSGLLSSVLTLDDDAPLVTIPGSVPGITEQWQGCRFAPRCVHAETACLADDITMRQDGGRSVRCRRSPELHLPGLAS